MTYRLGSTVTVVIRHESCGAVTADPIAVSCSTMDPKRWATLDLAVHDHIHRVSQELLVKSEILESVVAKGDLTIIEAY